MTKILAIEGTGIRLEIGNCDDCPCMDGEFNYCHLLGQDVVSFPEHPDRCPLPEKPHIPGSI